MTTICSRANVINNTKDGVSIIIIMYVFLNQLLVLFLLPELVVWNMLMSIARVCGNRLTLKVSVWLDSVQQECF